MQQRPADAQASSRALPRDTGLEASAAGDRQADASSTRSGRSASSHRSGRAPPTSANDQAALPALPDELLAALSRAPPGEVVGSSAGQAHGRTSLALDVDRPTFLHPSPPTLPDVPPQSPFGLGYPLASSPASPAVASPTTPRPPPQSPGPTPTATLGGFSSNRTAAAAPSPPIDDPSRSPGPPHQRRSPAPSPPLPRTLPSVSPSKRNVFKAFSFGRTRPPHPPLPAGASPSAEYAVPPNLSPPTSAPTTGSEPRPPSQWSRIANAPPALATTSAPPISANSSSSPSPSSASPFPSARARPADPPAAPHALERTRTASSATTAPSLDDDGAEADALARRWSARPGTAAEQFTRDLRGARRESGRALSSGQHAEDEDDEQFAYDDEADEDEGEGKGDEALGPRGAEASLGRRASTMSLRHQLAAFPQVEDHPLPLSSLPVHVEGADDLDAGDEDGAARRLSKLDLVGALVEREASAVPELEPEQRSPVSSADFIVAVVGPRSAGKSTVIRRGLKRPPSAPVVLQEDAEGNRVTTSTTSFSISGARRTIEVLEIDMGCLRYSDEGVVWPDGLPQCEGAMLCYDSTDPNSLDSLSLLLKAFWTRGSDVPLIVLACKAAPPTDSGAAGANATDPKAAASICNVYGAGIVTLDGGLDDPQRKTKECFNWLIRQIMDNRGELIRPASVASATATASTSSPTTSRRGSLRTSTPLAWATTSSSPITSRPPPPMGPLPDPPSTPHGPRSSRLVRSGSASLGLSVVEEAPLGTTVSTSSSSAPAAHDAEPDYEAEAQAVVSAMLASVAADEDEQHAAPAPLSPDLRRPSAQAEPASAAPTYTSEAPTYRSRQDEGEPEKEQFHAGVVPYPPPAAVERRGSTKPQSLDLFFKRDDLIDKFLFASVAGNDEQFVTLFLITFRRFARPYDVLEKLVERFHFVAGKMASDPLLCRFGQMKLCGVLSTWMQNYPGDFAAPTTFDLAERFLENLLPSGATWVAHYAFELVPLLPSIAKLLDPESGWALPDKAHVDPAFSPSRPPPSPRPPAPPMSRRGSLAPSYDSTSSFAHDAPSTSPSASRLSVPASLDPTESSSSPGFNHGLGASMQRTTSDTGTDGSSSVLARNGVPSSAVLVDLSNAVVEMREQDIATQITRIAWDVFGGMSPRDLLRHVLAPRDPHNPEVALRDSSSPVARSINFVNHLASWTATLILVQSKVKARARVVEKLLLVAVALREQENFDSLMGVLAGLNSQPIFRLTETMDLVTTKLDGDPRDQPHRTAQPDGDKNRLPKKLRSLNRLMAASKSFAAYRLALANSGINMIPYLGVHLQDLTVTNEMKSDMRGGNVNWSKMSQLGKSAAVVLDCARVAPKLAVDRTIERCILNAPVLDEDRQYALSYAHQPRQNGKTGARARLREFAKSTF